MLATLLFLTVVLMLTSGALGRPVRRVAAPSCSSGQQAMPNLKGLTLRSSPRVEAMGRLIKGLYYSDNLKGPHTIAAFYIACDRFLEPRPFLVMDFRSSRFSLDDDRDGCAEATGVMPLPAIDPADFYPAVDGADQMCDEEAVSQHQPNHSIGIP